MKSENPLNAVPGPHSPKRFMYAIFFGSEAPKREYILINVTTYFQIWTSILWDEPDKIILISLLQNFKTIKDILIHSNKTLRDRPRNLFSTENKNRSSIKI